ncbi:MAG TPA: DUF3995 domain-containing protein [Saprospiraceae bacterium]|nr:DUF3995 domain-containing protein [Saprospiraceae bacterium]
MKRQSVIAKKLLITRIKTKTTGILIEIIAYILVFIFITLFAVHIYWGLGGKWAGESGLPTKENGEKLFSPGPIPTFIVAFGLLGFAYIVIISLSLESSNLLTIQLIRKYGLLSIAGIFSLRALGDFKYVGFFKRIKTTNFGRLDSNYFSPLCAIIALMSIILQFFR